MSQVRIIVVEDEQIIALDLEDTLARLGYQVIATVDTGEEALALAETTQPALVLMDIKLRGALDGVAAAEQIGTRFSIPVIYITANADNSTLQRAKLTEPYGFVLKPFDERELQVTIELALYKHQVALKLRRLERWLAATLNSIGDAVVATDTSGRITFLNPVAAQLTGWSAEQAAGRALGDVLRLVDATTRAPLPDPVARVLREGLTVELDDQTLLLARDGREIAIDDSAAPIRDEHDTITGVVLVFRDVSARQAIERALRHSEERYALAARGTDDGLWDWDMQGSTLYLSPRWYEMLGLPHALGNTTPDSWFGRVHPDDISQLCAAIFDHLNGSNVQLHAEYRARHADGSYRWMLCRGRTVLDSSGIPVRLVGSQTDIQARKQAELDLQWAALHDPLTALPNRILFLDRLRHALDRTQRHQQQCAVLFLDLDHFKQVNDTLGHAAGDALLQALVARVAPLIREVDTLARIGGDEFTILLDGIASVADAQQVAERIQAALAEPLEVGQHRLSMSASIGIASGAAHESSADGLLQAADSALYQAKQQGRARYQVFDPAQMVLLQPPARHRSSVIGVGPGQPIS